MKKYVLTLCVALVSVCAFAQKGQKAVGLNLSYGSEISSFGIGAKGQYGFTDALRGEASFDYFFGESGSSMWDINANVHYLFPVAKGIKIYPLAGLAYTNWKTSYTDIEEEGNDWKEVETSSNEGKIGVNLGCGAQYDINDKWMASFEIKYQIISNFNQMVLGLGVAYKF